MDCARTFLDQQSDGSLSIGKPINVADERGDRQLDVQRPHHPLALFGRVQHGHLDVRRLSFVERAFVPNSGGEGLVGVDRGKLEVVRGPLEERSVVLVDMEA